RALSVREELNLDVSRALEVALEVDAVVAERGRGLAPRGRDGVAEFRSRADDAHPAPAAARRRLDEQRRLVDLGHDRHPGFAGDALRLELVPARAQRGGRRADPGEPRLLDERCELGVLREEAVARVDRVRAALARRPEMLVGREVRRDLD